MKPITD